MNETRRRLLGVALLVWALLSAGTLWAQQWAEGTVKRVDAANGKLTLQHSDIKELDMPPMTMVFTLKDPEWIKGLAPGQQVRFQAIDLGGGKLQIVAIEVKPK